MDPLATLQFATTQAQMVRRRAERLRHDAAESPDTRVQLLVLAHDLDVVASLLDQITERTRSMFGSVELSMPQPAAHLVATASR